MILAINSSHRVKHRFWLTSFHQKHYYSVLSEDHKLISLLESCKQTSEVSQIHGSLIKSGLDGIAFKLSKLLASSSLIDIQYAASIFKHIENPNLFMFNTMLRGYSIADDPNQSFVLFNYVRAQNFLLDQFSFVSTLKSCARLCTTWYGKGIHSIVLQSGFDLFVKVKNALMQFYSVCGDIRGVHQLFEEFPQERDLVSWNTLMGGYLHASQPTVVLDLFRQLYRASFRIDISSVFSALSAIGDLRIVLDGESLHGYCIKTRLHLDTNVVTALIAMYGKIGYVHSGRRLFDEVPVKDIVLWNCLIDGYAKNGLLEESVALIQSMNVANLKPNSSTLAGLLSACATSGALAMGQCICKYVENEELVLDTVLGTALVDMYCKSGSFQKAIDMFNRIKSKDVKSWTAMISGFGVNGQAKIAITSFQRMKEEGYRPNEVTFLAVLNACSHGGMVIEGIKNFESMVRDYGLIPKVEHYGCIIDLLGRAGLLEEAYRVIKSLPIEGDASAWRSLLAACRVYGNVDLGKCVKRVLDEVNGEHPADKIVLLGTYAIAGRMRADLGIDEMEERNIIRGEAVMSALKEAGLSMIELENQGGLER